jgi:precorrin-6A synthase
VRTLLIVGIGAGDPDQVTVQAIKALSRADVIFEVEKAADDLVGLRHEIVARYAAERGPRTVLLPDPSRDRTAAAYGAAVEAWREQRADVWGVAIERELGDDGVGAFLVWGDPGLYDSTIAVIDRIRARGRVAFDHEVIPGISSPQALAARHRIPLNRVGGSVEITTGRRLDDGFGEDAVVMLDAACAFTDLAAAADIDIYWGAYVGTPDEILIAGPLGEVAEEIVRVRREARERKGWIMDTYLLRRSRATE